MTSMESQLHQRKYTDFNQLADLVTICQQTDKSGIVEVAIYLGEDEDYHYTATQIAYYNDKDGSMYYQAMDIKHHPKQSVVVVHVNQVIAQSIDAWAEEQKQ